MSKTVAVVNQFTQRRSERTQPRAQPRFSRYCTGQIFSSEIMEGFDMFNINQASSHFVDAIIKLSWAGRDSDSIVPFGYEVHEIRTTDQDKENFVVSIATKSGRLHPNIIDTVRLSYDFKPGTLYKIVLTVSSEDSSPTRTISTQRTFRKCK